MPNPKKITFDNPRISLFPTPAVVVTSVNNSGAVGGATIGWNGVLSSRPPIISVSFLPDSFTRACILESRDFVVNVPDGRYWRETNYLGSISCPWDEKIRRAPATIAPLTLVESHKVRAPQIVEFYLNFECRMLRMIQIGLYDCILGEVLAMHCNAAVYHKKHPKGGVDHHQIQPILCLADEYWSGNSFLGVSTENKAHPHGSEH